MAITTHHGPRRIHLVAVPESSGSVLYSLYEVFCGVGRVWSEITGEAVNTAPFDVQIVAGSKQAFRCALGIPVAPHASVRSIDSTDIIIAPNLEIAPDFNPRGRWKPMVTWLRQMHDKHAVICSACTGSVLLAEAGLLQGQVATTHWSAAEIFRRHYPDVKLTPERILVPIPGEQDIITSGGAGAWQDLVMYLIARFRGEAEAIRTAKLWLMGDRTEGQLPFAAIARPQRHDDAVISDCQAWIAEHYTQASPIAAMVGRSRLVERTFGRRFRAATGYTPVEYVQALRVEEAKHLLETTDTPTEAIGQLVGYEDPAFFRRVFKRRAGVTPARYRKRFRGIGHPG